VARGLDVSGGARGLGSDAIRVVAKSKKTKNGQRYRKAHLIKIVCLYILHPLKAIRASIELVMKVLPHVRENEDFQKVANFPLR
jgi:hypothetical protein